MGPLEQTRWLSVERDGDRYRVRTAERFVRRRRRNIQLLGGGVALVGVGLSFVWAWSLTLVVIGVAALLLAPQLVRPSELVELDAAHDRLTALQPPASAATSVALSSVREIAGAYEVHGWNPYSTIYAVLGDGSRVPLAVFTGADESMPEEACRVIGRLTRRPAVYAGQYGDPKRCFDPATA